MNPPELMNHYRQMVLGGLSSAKTPGDYARLLTRIYADFAQQQESVRAANNINIVCKAGCFYCCYIKVDVHAHEAMFLIEHIQRALSKEQIDALFLRCKDHRERILPQSLEQQMTTNNPCPMLVEGKCSVYQGRPFSCRNYHAQRLEPCIYGFENPADSQTENSTTHKALMSVGAAAWVGTSMAYTEAGYDDRTYDLGLALYERLTNPKCVRHWRDKKSAFSNECIAKDQQSVSR